MNDLSSNKVNKSRPEMPECRYCKSTTHTSKEWDICVQSNLGADVSPQPIIFEGVGDKLVKDCTSHELMMSLQAISPDGLIIARPLKPNIESGGDLEILFSGPQMTLLKLSQFISYVAITGLKDNNGKSPGQSQ